MQKCSMCGEDVIMPFLCKSCQGNFCALHRLPENHGCQRTFTPWKTTETYATDWPSFTEPSSPRRRSVFYSEELRDLIIAWLVLGVAFSMGSLMRSFAVWSFSAFLLPFAVTLVTLGLGFIGHELAHRFVAIRLGCSAVFKLWMWGLLMALFLAAASGGGFVFAAPGAVYITPGRSRNGWIPTINKQTNGYISLAGPAANILIAMGFLMLTDFSGLLGDIGSWGYRVNLLLAAFNLIPLSIMDGRKVFAWNPLVWAGVAIPTWILFVTSFLL